ncbi:MAG: hypothetical protein F2579_04605, partial [Actinobacteria bacterium]|nr:hypothetical protein [Actinomycetota bacterium]
MPSSSCTNTSGHVSTHSPSPVQRSWSIHTCIRKRYLNSGHILHVMTMAPLAPKRLQTLKRPTGEVEDPFAWLIQKDDPETLAYLAAENSFSTEWFASRGKTVEDIFQEIKGRVHEDDSSYPVSHAGWWYQSRTETGKAYAIHTRGRTSDTAGDQLLIDENIEAG